MFVSERTVPISNLKGLHPLPRNLKAFEPLAISVATALWAAFVLVAFYREAPLASSFRSALAGIPWSAPAPGVLLDYAAGLLGWAVLFLNALMLGDLVLARSGAGAKGLERLVLAAALGYGLLAYLAFALGVAQLLYRPVLRTLLIAGSIASIYYGYRNRAGLRRTGAEWRDVMGGTPLAAGFAAALLLLIGFAGVMAFVPELFYDARNYHLGLPNFYLQEKGIEPIRHMCAKFPAVVQMIYLLGLSLKDEMVTKLTHVGFGVLVAAGILAFGKKHRQPLAGLVAAVLLWAVPTLQINLWTSGVDGGVMLFGFLSWLCLAEKRFVLSAVFSGLAVSSKYQAVLVPALAIVTHLLVNRKTLRAALLQSMLYGAIVLVIFSPWMIKNIVQTGNPVFPFFPALFNSGIAPEKYQALLEQSRFLLPITGPISFFGVIWSLCISIRNSLSFQGPLFLMLTPVLLWALIRRKNPQSSQAVLWSAIYLAVLMAVTHVTRYGLPAVAVLAVALGLSAATLLQESRLTRAVLALVIFAGVAVQAAALVVRVAHTLQPGRVLLGQVTRSAFVANANPLLHSFPSTEMFVRLPGLLKEGDRVLLVGDEKAYGLPVPHLYSGVFDESYLVSAAESSGNGAEMAEQLRNRGVTHLLLNILEARRIAPYGVFAISPTGEKTLHDFFLTQVRMKQALSTPFEQGMTNALILLEMTPRQESDSSMKGLIEALPQSHSGR